METLTVISDGNHFEEKKQEDEIEKKPQAAERHLRIEDDFDQLRDVEFLFFSWLIVVCVSFRRASGVAIVIAVIRRRRRRRRRFEDNV